jgi:hypothetical protein
MFFSRLLTDLSCIFIFPFRFASSFFTWPPRPASADDVFE